jgi:DNA-binding NarL/FixJ family response regulator
MMLQTFGHVLVVDGDPKSRAFICGLLERAGWSTEGAATGEEAIARARAGPPRLVILEVSLPGTSGYEVCRELRDEFGDELPIILVSGTKTDELDQTAGLLVGADDYLTKPVSPDALLARARRLLARSAHSPAAVEERLTPRETEVLSLLVAGLRPAEIAKQLVISRATVAKHIERILSQLNVHTQAQAVAIAVRNGLAGTSATRLPRL